MEPEVRQPRNPVPVSTRDAAERSGMSPVDEILAMPQGKSRLDTKPSEGPVPKWTWLLPLILLLPGGIVGWLIVRDTNRTAGRLMIVIGTVMTVLTLLTLGPMKSLAGMLGM